MAKRVVYNGREDDYFGASDPSILEKGKVYEVEKVNLGRNWTLYVLKGVRGKFNSVWFDKPEYFAISNTIPVIGKEMIIALVGDTRRLRTTPPISVTKVGNTVFKAETENSIYFVKLQ